MEERGRFRDSVAISGNAGAKGLIESGIHDTEMRIHRFKNDRDYRRVLDLFPLLNRIYSDTSDPELLEMREKIEAFSFRTTLHKGNILLNAGINDIWNALAGVTGLTAYSNANARIGVGDSTTAAAATQTGLQATTNKAYAGMNASYPIVGSSQQAIFQASFGGSVANYAWNEFVTDNGGTALIALNRLVSAQGTKTSGQTWTVTMTITLS